jgi:hypothetical protein
VKIMLIGGSVTEGSDSSRSYRYYLDGMLRRKGHLIDFVGSRNKHNDNKSEPDSYQFDPDHEGHPGKNEGWFVENMPRLLEQNNPDIAVIELGAQDHKINDGDVQGINLVIESLRDKNPQVNILIANTEPAEGKKKATAILNEKIVSSDQSSVTVAEIDWDARSANHLPSAEEARKIAAILAEAISPLMPSKKPSHSK